MVLYCTNDLKCHDFDTEEVLDCSAAEAAWLAGIEIFDPMDYYTNPWQAKWIGSCIQADT